MKKMVNNRTPDKYEYVIGENSPLQYDIFEESIIDGEVVKGKKTATIILYQIRALKDFTFSDRTVVKAGTLGGYIEKGCLSQKGKCWVWKGTKVYGTTRVFDDAQVQEGAELGNNTGSLFVCKNATVAGRITQNKEEVCIIGSAKIELGVKIHHNKKPICIADEAIVGKNVEIFNNGKNISVCEGVTISENSKICNYTDEIFIDNGGGYLNFKINPGMYKILSLIPTR